MGIERARNLSTQGLTDGQAREPQLIQNKYAFEACMKVPIFNLRTSQHFGSGNLLLL